MRFAWGVWLLLVAALSDVGWAGPTEEALYRRAVGSVIRASFEAAGTITATAGKQISLRFRHAFREGRRAYIEVTAPNDFRGQRWLIWDRDAGADQVWYFDPKTQRVSEVPEDQWKLPWLGTGFALADFFLPDPDAYVFELGGEENIGGETFTVLRLAPKQKEKDRYAIRVYSVDPRSGRLRRALFFDHEGRATARWIVDRTEQRGSEWFAAQQRVIHLLNQTSSVLTLTDFRYEPQLAADAFDPGGLAPRPTPSPQ